MALPTLNLTRSTVGRAVHVQIVPRTSNIGESREIYRLLSQFGEIEHFRSLKYERMPSPNAAIVIYKTPAAAEACQGRSPIMISLGSDGSQPSGTQQRDVAAGPNAIYEHHQGDSATEKDNSGRSLRGKYRIFNLYINKSYANLNKDIELSPFHGKFTVSGRHTPNLDLRLTVPTQGMADVEWRQEKRPGRDVERERLEDPLYSERVSLRRLYEEYQKDTAEKSEEKQAG